MIRSWERTLPQPPAELQRGLSTEASPSQAAKNPLQSRGSLKPCTGSPPALPAVTVPDPASTAPERSSSQPCSKAERKCRFPLHRGQSHPGPSTPRGKGLACTAPGCPAMPALERGWELNNSSCTGQMQYSRMQTRDCAQVSARSLALNAHPCGACRWKCTPQADTYMNIV